MNPPGDNPHTPQTRANFARRVLDADLRTRGHRFVVVEFAACASLCAVVAVAVVFTAVAHHSRYGAAALAAIFLIGATTNAVATLRAIRTSHPDATPPPSRGDLTTFVIATLIPFALARALHRR